MPSQAKNLANRPPVVVVMGHIDHGKSTLLDYIRKTNVVAGEAGGITQHVGAYEAEWTNTEGRTGSITFLDTPGHAAFSGIRERGARAADIAILVVSAEDGVKPQTVEAYRSIQREKIPFIVAITKIDKPNADPNRAKQTLGENEIYVEGWGGDVPCVAVSAVTGEGIPELLEMIVLVADLAGLKADPLAPAQGLVIESSLDSRKGVSATLLVRQGTLTTGSFIVAGESYAPVRFIEDFQGKKITEASAGRPARIIGWSLVPQTGAIWSVVKDKKEAERMTADFAAEEKRRKSREAHKPVVAKEKNKEEKDQPEEPQIVTLPLVIKADALGSLEGIKSELSKIRHDKVELKIAYEGIGNINENDVKLAMSDPEMILIGFNAEPDKKAAAMIERSSIPIHLKTFSVIYELSEYVNQALTAKIPKEYVEEVTGRAKVMALFSKEKDRQVIGGRVETGTIESGNEVRIMRRDVEIGRGKIRELQSKKLRVSEVAEGHEFGMMAEAKIEIAPGDKIEAVRTVEKK